MGKIDKITVYKFQGQRMIGIYPKDLKLFLRKKNTLTYVLMKLNMMLGCAPANIAQVILPVPVEELAKKIQVQGYVKVEFK